MAAPASAGARNCGDGRHAAPFQPAKNAIHENFVAERVFRRLEIAEKRDVRARGERLSARAGDDQNLDRIVRVHRLT